VTAARIAELRQSAEAREEKVMVVKGHQVEVEVIPNCDLCLAQTHTVTPAYADAKTRFGWWANVCKAHFDTLECRTGAGSGQEYVMREGNQ
jgi:hypothetical protein